MPNLVGEINARLEYQTGVNMGGVTGILLPKRGFQSCRCVFWICKLWNYLFTSQVFTNFIEKLAMKRPMAKGPWAIARTLDPVAADFPSVTPIT